MGSEAWSRCLEQSPQPHDFARLLAERFPDVADTSVGAPPWAADLARLEWGLELVRRNAEYPVRSEGFAVHPALQLLTLSWTGLCGLLSSDQGQAEQPELGEEHVVLWPHAETPDRVFCRPATAEDLLALKIVAEELPLAEVAKQANVALSAVRALLHRTAVRGLLLEPASLLVRPPETHPRPDDETIAVPEEVFSGEFFTMQWHITQRCDLRCRHCYDRSPRQDAPLEAGLRLLDQLAAFCDTHHVQGQATFTGGNPLLHPHFLQFYQGAVERGLHVALLGNPGPPEELDALLAVERPVYFQVSLEGLEEHNDTIRGKGHYRRAMRFLELLRERGISSQVMLTLTQENMRQVIPLARELEGRVERFTFNRLAPVGEGAALACAERDAYPAFLDEYIATAQALPHVRYKDNLLNVRLLQRKEPLFGGCTGHGCGAAFNFLAVLGDGEAHACRKMHSPIGNVFEQGLAGVYHGEAATRYRRGSAACAGCALRAVCGGCLAVTAGLGLDPLTARDPYCFFAQAP